MRRPRLGGSVARSPEFGGAPAVGAMAGPALPPLRMPQGGGAPNGPGETITGPPAPAGIDPALWDAARSFAQQIALKATLRQLPEDSPIPSAKEFEYSSTVATSAPGTQALPLDDGTGTGGPSKFVLSNQYTARIASVFLIAAGTITVATKQLFTLYSNGTPIRGWINRRVIPTPSNGYTQPFPAKILLDPGSEITATVNNVDGGSYTDGIMLVGWLWSVAAGDAWNRGQ